MIKENAGGRGAVVGTALFVGLQTFALVANQDRWGVLFFFTRQTWLLVLLLWLKNLALASAAGAAAGWLLSRALRLPDPEKEGASGAEAAFVVLALTSAALGIGLRWAFPQSIPPGLWFDPPFEARRLLLQPQGLPWFGGVPLLDDPVRAGNRELVSYLYLHFYGAMLKLFGRTDTGYLAFSAAPGCLTLAAGYWLAREVYGARAALLGVSLVSFSFWHLVFSRWSYTASALIPLALLSAAAALAALRTGRRWLALASGLFLGLSLHTHSSSWAVAAGLGVFSLFEVRRRESRPAVLIAWGAALLAFAPFGWGYLTHPQNIGGRLRDVPAGTRVSGAYGPSVTGPLRVPAVLAYNAIEYSGILLFTTDPNPRDGLPGRRAVTPLLGIAAMAGLGASLARGTRADRALILLVLGSLAAGVLSNPGGAPNGIRICVVVIPALLSAAWLLHRLLTLMQRRGLGRAWLGAAGIAAFSLGSEAVPFLSLWPVHPMVVRAFCPAETSAARIVRTLSDDPVLLAPNALQHPFVFDALSGGVDPRVPIRQSAQRPPSSIAATPPNAPFWYVARRVDLEELSAAGFRCARGIAPFDGEPEIVLARVVPPEG